MKSEDSEEEESFSFACQLKVFAAVVGVQLYRGGALGCAPSTIHLSMCRTRKVEITVSRIFFE